MTTTLFTDALLLFMALEMVIKAITKVRSIGLVIERTVLTTGGRGGNCLSLGTVIFSSLDRFTHNCSQTNLHVSCRVVLSVNRASILSAKIGYFFRVVSFGLRNTNK